jgi:stage II sporulation protein D
MKTKIFLLLFPACFTALLFSSCGNLQKPLNEASPLVRIFLCQGKEIILRPYKNYILSVNSKKEMGEGPLFVSLSNNKIEINGSLADVDSLEILPTQSFEFRGKHYRGGAKIIKDGNSLLLINTLDIESYLYGVLPGEVSEKWNREALKAQAVVSRTYALYEVANSRKSNRPFDLYADTRSQVYEGMDSETKITSSAVDLTMGEVLRYQGKIIQSFFHSASGGMTESAKEAFGDDKPYLSSIYSPFASLYPDNKWEIDFPAKNLERELKWTNFIASISVTERTLSKRIKKLEVFDSLSNKTILSGKDFRNLIGNSVMKSSRANIRLTNRTLLISGVGYGHGVGMGQWDAQIMATQGYAYKSIVQYFYTGTSVDKVW